MFQTVGKWLSGPEAAALLVVLALATLGTASLFVVGVVGYRRRGTMTYLLVAVVLGLLVGRSIMGFGTAMGLVPMSIHHLIEHGSDFLVATIILYALYRTGSPSPSA